ncbi:PREDICTED: 5-hydroxytryptamine receptor 2A-like isoform X1 [Vollenhovia emeryi]|uniref:5-hydroxytryptamine receptor 2A-like isoform X1 n=1 Tax=Vollenhovia emeryi TaxID=411798 RepID=UPI0005F46FED|nr:PREDICTED: 5-hydroxytryptamine receptor 2A-like isoform X1 [Vollenhovia emeryi]XP_011870302.1 PREDICTED: 5-hydroxytryptamine receptor 2A-like isoform X1 [Vollenhovia emeryi]XP_011870303.1 PREDICTED: 5-hydroxytryptamine receptor 2A-like isoform X1 [Vollenhovia emeryi]XP_011870304.1 PREDICTED: 5-hydroxytryptamine receptor 2A-like isoform X1 [Vollenhovia emeryi]XP_011870305.1 PREDICTED: 5-hydroxytryptamine receptor 2A-like isoform X1 [Vollenhovia emeryi]XP_011870306.1 PREDICTED: 5-hydroxytrypt
METPVDQAANATVENPVFIDVPIILRAIVLCLLILITIVGNLFVIAAILLERNLQSVANYLIVSLAVADLMVACLVMPLGAVYEINSAWSLGPELCDMWTSSDVLCCTASILHLVAIAVDRYWAVTDINYIQARNPRRIGILIVTVWVVSLGISLAPQFGWKDPDYLVRIAQGTCLVSQDSAYQIFATCATFYVPLLVILFLYWRIFQAARKRIRKRPGTILQPPRERRGILRLVTRSTQYFISSGLACSKNFYLNDQCRPREQRPREESTAFTITRTTPDHSSISPEKSSSYNGANATPSTTVTPTAVSTTTTTTTTTTLTNPTSTSQQQPVVKCTKRTRETIESKRERKAAKTLAIITGAFVACWLPFFFTALLQATCRICQPPEIVSSVFLWLGYFNSTLNPVIYTVFSPEFRQAFKRMLCGGTRGLR